jgi:hypothetical protein
MIDYLYSYSPKSHKFLLIIILKLNYESAFRLWKNIQINPF